jgi:hypothetical protein
MDEDMFKLSATERELLTGCLEERIQTFVKGTKEGDPLLREGYFAGLAVLKALQKKLAN